MHEVVAAAQHKQPQAVSPALLRSERQDTYRKNTEKVDSSPPLRAPNTMPCPCTDQVAVTVRSDTSDWLRPPFYDFTIGQKNAETIGLRLLLCRSALADMNRHFRHLGICSDLPLATPKLCTQPWPPRTLPSSTPSCWTAARPATSSSTRTRARATRTMT